MNNTLRAVLAAGIVYVALFGIPDGISPPVPGAGYSGPLTAAHTAAASMESQDRAGLSAALAASGKMLRSDPAGLLKTTEDVQEFVRGTTAYGYSSFSLKKYPDVADAVQAELEKAVGSEIKAIDSSDRARIADTLEELGRAVR